MVGSSSQQRQLIAYHVEFTEEEHPQPAPSPEHSLAYRRPTGGGRQVTGQPGWLEFSSAGQKPFSGAEM